MTVSRPLVRRYFFTCGVSSKAHQGRRHCGDEYSVRFTVASPLYGHRPRCAHPCRLGKRAEHRIKLVSRARRLGREIAPVFGVDRPVQWHPPADIDACAREPVKLARVVGHQANPGAAKHLQHSNGDPVVAFIIVEPENDVGVDRVEFLHPAADKLESCWPGRGRDLPARGKARCRRRTPPVA